MSLTLNIGANFRPNLTLFKICTMWALESISCKYQRLGFKIFGFCQDVVDWKIINFNLISAWSSPFDKIVLKQANYKIIV